MDTFNYKPREEFRPSDLDGISEEQISQHWSLYEGYVKNVNLLNKKLAQLVQKGDFGNEFSELKRRLSFEYDGMILHEHYFGILKMGQEEPQKHGELMKMFRKHFGGFEQWKEEFVATGGMRGIGWVILYYDPVHRNLLNFWISSHEYGHPAGCVPILVMDVWEHAYMVDWGIQGRPQYIDNFFRNIDWDKVEINLHEAMRTALAGHI